MLQVDSLPTHSQTEMPQWMLFSGESIPRCSLQDPASSLLLLSPLFSLLWLLFGIFLFHPLFIVTLSFERDPNFYKLPSVLFSYC